MMHKSKDADKEKQAYRCPIKLNNEQAKFLYAWTSSLRYLWNRSLALILRLRKSGIYMNYYGIRKKDKATGKYVDCSDNGTNKRLTKIRSRLNWQKDIPNCAQQEVLLRLDKAWKRFHSPYIQAIRQKKIAEAKTSKEKAIAIDYGKPKFKAKFHDQVSASFTKERFSVAEENGLYYLSLSKIPSKIRILSDDKMPPLERIKTVTVEYDAVKSMWFASFIYIVDFVKKDYPVKDVLGLDAGLRTSWYASDGSTFKIDEDQIKSLEDEKKRLQRFLDKKYKASKANGNNNKAKKSSRYIKLSHKIRVIDRKMSDIRKNFQHQMSKKITDTYPIIGVEDLSIQKMMASAKGTVENPGKNVKQKTALNKAIARQGWYQARTLIAYKQKRNGGVFVLNDPAYSSVTCNNCGHISKNNRDGENFKCEKCGFEINADHGASIEIRSRTIASLPVGTLEKYGIGNVL